MNDSKIKNLENKLDECIASKNELQIKIKLLKTQLTNLQSDMIGVLEEERKINEELHIAKERFVK